MTWNEYLDIVRYFLEQRLCGICGANVSARIESSKRVYYLRLELVLLDYAIKNNISCNRYYWPIEDRQSRINFLESLKDK